MKTATITQAKNQLSALIDRVRHGETIVITDRGRPVARLVSALSGVADDPDGRLARLERRGGLRRATTSPPASPDPKNSPHREEALRCARCAARGATAGAVRFWDSSALAPLLVVPEAMSRSMQEFYERDPVMVAW